MKDLDVTELDKLYPGGWPGTSIRVALEILRSERDMARVDLKREKEINQSLQTRLDWLLAQNEELKLLAERLIDGPR